jgi:alpha-tubulin suppressor-like RCC1 family protein
VSAGYSHTLAIKKDGSLWAWGWNNYLQLGLGDNNERNSPTRVGTGTDWAAVSAGYSHSLAIKKDGGLWAWGYGSNGQLGLDSWDESRNSPTRVGTGTDWAAVSASVFHSLAIKKDGSLWAWGNNDQGQLGLGNYSDRNSPARAGTEAEWAAVAAGYCHTLAIKKDGSLWAWGLDDCGELGIGNAASGYHTNSPARVGAGTNWAAVTAHSEQTLAIKKDGGLWAWGQGSEGQLGLGDRGNRNTPASVGAGTDWAAVSAGGSHSLGVKKDGSLWAWGNNDFGQLGLGDTASRNAPARVTQ